MDSDAPTWDLEAIVPGGPGGPEFIERLQGIQARIDALRQRVDAMPPLEDDLEAWATIIGELDPVDDTVSEICSYAVCAAAANTRSIDARRAEGASRDLWRSMQGVTGAVAAALDAASEATFEQLLALPAVQTAAPQLRHVRAGAALRLPREQQDLKLGMDRESLTGWGQLYDLVQGGLSAEITLDGETKPMGVAQLAALRAHADPTVRDQAFHAAARAWSTVQDVCAHTLTQITGARQQFHDRLGVDELAPSLHRNRIERATLDAMWAASEALKPSLVTYLERKAQLFGQERLPWWDRDAPLPADTGTDMAWTEACDTIRAAFGAFHPELEQFAARAVDGRWIDAASREGRRQGGFCTGMPMSRQSRIFMTFAGTMDNALTLAHELGHAYHNEVLQPVPASRREITSALAETASTFAEATVRHHVLDNATDPRFRAFMLDQELQAAVAFLMDIPARYGFERRLYALRREGMLSAEVLSQEMVGQQRHAYGGALGSWSETFWCSKLHFYIPEFGFYNWPYTFGYLFSAAVYARARAEGPGFLDTLKDLLLRTGWQSSEELAQATLGVDLTDPAFWVEAAQPIEGQVAAFLDATA